MSKIIAGVVQKFQDRKEILRKKLLLLAERVLMFTACLNVRLVNMVMQAHDTTENQFIVIVSPKVRAAVEIATPHVRMVDPDRGKGGEEKMLRALRLLRKVPVLSKLEGSVPAKRGWKVYSNKSQLRWIAETAIQVGEGRLRLSCMHGGKE